MKIFKDITDAPNKYLLMMIQKVSIGLFCTGLTTGIAIAVAAISSKNNNFEDALMFSGSAIFFLFLSIGFYALGRHILSEFEKRLNGDK